MSQEQVGMNRGVNGAGNGQATSRGLRATERSDVFSFYYLIIVVLGILCDIYKSAYNIS
jgi:hypothetical protein